MGEGQQDAILADVRRSGNIFPKTPCRLNRFVRHFTDLVGLKKNLSRELDADRC
jgi:hypothetical protein